MTTDEWFETVLTRLLTMRLEKYKNLTPQGAVIDRVSTGGKPSLPDLFRHLGL